jgi:hypothetical protein
MIGYGVGEDGNCSTWLAGYQNGPLMESVSRWGQPEEQDGALSYVKGLKKWS